MTLSPAAPRRALLRVLLALLVGVSLPLVDADRAGAACASSTNRTISGTIRGETGRYVNAFVGIALFDSAGRPIDREGCPIGAGYANADYTDPQSGWINRNVGPEGTTNPGGGVTFTWSLSGLPANAAEAWVEVYPKNTSNQTIKTHYGSALAARVDVGSGSRSGIDLRMPIVCGRTIDGVAGSTGSIRGRIFVDGVERTVTRMAAWSEEHGRADAGWGVDNASTVGGLASGQRYTVIVTSAYGTRKLYGVLVPACGTTDVVGVIGDPPSGLPPKWGSLTLQVAGLYQPLSGDFDGDGRGDVLWYGPGTVGDSWWWGTSTRGSWSAQATSVVGHYRPVNGDFDGDGRDEILWYAPGGAKDFVWDLAANKAISSSPRTINGTYQPFVGDFDGNGRDDIFWYSGTSHSYLWLHKIAGGYTSRLVPISAGWAPQPGDWDGDGEDDILWYDPVRGRAAVWFGAPGGSFTHATEGAGPGYRLVTGDFNRDGRDDVMFHGPGSWGDYLWTGRARTAPIFAKGVSGNVTGSFFPFAGDFDGDGAGDIFWYAPGSSADAVWYPNPVSWGS